MTTLPVPKSKLQAAEALARRKEELGVPLDLKNVFTPQEIDEFKDLFIEVDVDGSSSIDKNELMGVFQRLGISATPEEVGEIFVAVDTDGSGEIEFGEFVRVRLKHLGPSSGARLKEFVSINCRTCR